MKSTTPANVQALADYLRLCIQARRITQRSIERQLGMAPGYLGQLLRGNVDLKVKHLLAVLHAIGMEPGDFFSALYGGQPAAAPRSPAPDPMRFDLGSPPSWQRGEVVPGVSEARLDRAVREALLRLGFPPSREPAKEEHAPPAQRRRGGRKR